MAESYQITTQGLMDGFSKEQVADMLAILFKRSKDEIQPMLGSAGFVVKKGIDFPAAIRYKVALEQRGCKCAIESDAASDLLTSQFPDTILNDLEQAPETVPLINSRPPGLSLMEIDEEPVAPAPVAAAQAVVAKVVAPPVNMTPPATNEIGTTVGGEPFLVQTPQDFCCNCGEKSHIAIVETQFVKHLVFSTRFEKEHSITLDLPYCSSCAESVGHYPMSAALKWLIGFAIWILGLMLLMPQVAPQKHLIVRLLFLVLPLIPGIVVFRWIGKPKAPQTSKYTPVIIKEYSRNPNSIRQEGRAMLLASIIAQVIGWLYKKVSKHDPDKIDKITIKFSHPLYAKAFKKANKSFIQSAYIKVV